MRSWMLSFMASSDEYTVICRAHRGDMHMVNPPTGLQLAPRYNSHLRGNENAAGSASLWTAVAHTQNPPVSGGVAIKEKVEGKDVRLSQGLFGWFLLAQPAFRLMSLVSLPAVLYPVLYRVFQPLPAGQLHQQYCYHICVGSSASFTA